MTTAELREFGEFLFEPPPSWENRDIVAYVGRPETRGGMAPNIVVTREERVPGETIQAHAFRRLLELTKMLDGLRLLETCELQVGGRPAVKTHYVSATDRGDLEQVIVYLDAPAPSLVTVTCSAIASEDRPWMPLLERVLASARFAHPSSSPEAQSSEPPPTAPSRPPPSAPRDESAAAPMIPMPGARAARA